MKTMYMSGQSLRTNFPSSTPSSCCIWMSVNKISAASPFWISSKKLSPDAYSLISTSCYSCIFSFRVRRICSLVCSSSSTIAIFIISWIHLASHNQYQYNILRTRIHIMAIKYIGLGHKKMKGSCRSLSDYGLHKSPFSFRRYIAKTFPSCRG